MNKFAFLWTALVVSFVKGSLIYRKKSNHNITVIVPAFNANPWDEPAFASQISPSLPVAIVNLDEVHGTYNPCNQATFTPVEFVKMFPNGEPWMGVVQYNRLSLMCNGHIPYHFYYYQNGNRWAQVMGAAGFMSVSGNSHTEMTTMPPEVLVKEKSVSGVVITIVAIATPNNIPEQATLLGQPDEWEIVHVQGDYNDQSELQNVFGAYRILWTLQGVFIVCVMLFSLYRTKEMLEFFEYGRDVKQRKNFHLRIMILVPEFLGGFCRLLFCIDPLGLWYVWSFIFSRSMLNAAATLSCFTNIVTAFFCYDVYRLFKGARSMQKTESLTSKYPWIETAVVAVALVLVAVDATVSLLSLYGYGGAASTLVPALYQLVVNSIISFFTTNLNFHSKKEINLMLISLKEKEAAASKGSTSTVEFLRRTVEKFDRTRVFMMRAIYGVILGLLCLVGIGAGVIYLSNLAYAIIMQGTVVALNIIMTFQLFTALELPVKDSRSAASSRSVAVSPKSTTVGGADIATLGATSVASPSAASHMESTVEKKKNKGDIASRRESGIKRKGSAHEGSKGPKGAVSSHSSGDDAVSTREDI